MGTVLGSSGFSDYYMVAYLFPSYYGEHYLRIAFTVGISLMGVVLWGTLVGSMLPIDLEKTGADPAVISAPFVATLVDVTGLLSISAVAFTDY